MPPAGWHHATRRIPFDMLDDDDSDDTNARPKPSTRSSAAGPVAERAQHKPSRCSPQNQQGCLSGEVAVAEEERKRRSRIICHGQVNLKLCNTRRRVLTNGTTSEGAVSRMRSTAQRSGTRLGVPDPHDRYSVNNSISPKCENQSSGSGTGVEQGRQSPQPRTGSKRTKTGRKRTSRQVKDLAPRTPKKEQAVDKTANTTEVKHHINLLFLPGELRNEIYSYLVPENRVLIKRSQPNKEEDYRKSFWSEEHVKVKRPTVRLFHWREVTSDRSNDSWLSDARSLMLVNKQIKCEIIPYLYYRTRYCFASIKNLSIFLDVTSECNRAAITKLEINSPMYGNSWLVQHEIHRERYLKSWDLVTKKVGERLPNLRSLKISATLSDWPCMLAVPQSIPWWKSCLQMAPARMEEVRAAVSHPMIAENRTARRELSLKLENDMMTIQGQHIRDKRETELVLRQLERKRLVRAAKAAVREEARLALLRPAPVVTIPSQDIARQIPSQKKTRQKGLEHYTSIETPETGLAPME